MSQSFLNGGDKTGSVKQSLSLALVAAAVLGFGWYLFSQPPALERSVLGVNGFAYFAKSNGVDIKPFNGEYSLDPKQVGLRILPLYDPDITKRIVGDENAGDLRQELRKMQSWIFRLKTDSIPTLVVLPKWRFGTLSTERLHPDLLIDLPSIAIPNLGSKTEVGAPYLARGENNLRDMVVTGHEGFPSARLNLYAPQTLRLDVPNSDGCRAIIAAQDHQIILARCPYGSRDFWLLTDPDVINNHGAGRGENALFALNLVKHLANGKPAIIDYTSRSFLAGEQKARPRGRAFSDLARFFQYPFAYFWAGMAFLSAFTLWHTWWRTGPVETGERENQINTSKATAIEANVHILRAAGRDAPLAARYVEQQMDSLAFDLLGVHRRGRKTAGKQLIDTIFRRSPQLAIRLAQLRDLLTKNMPDQSRLASHLIEFEQNLQEIRHEFGRTSPPRR